MIARDPDAARADLLWPINIQAALTIAAAGLRARRDLRVGEMSERRAIDWSAVANWPRSEQQVNAAPDMRGCDA